VSEVALATKPQRRFDAVLYDHDGTLVNSLPVVVEATNRVLLRHGYAPALAEQIIAGMVLATAPRMGHHARTNNAAEQSRMAADFYAEARVLGPQLATAYMGVAEMLRSVSQLKIPQGVISNNQSEVVRLILTHLKLADRFELMYGEDHVPAPKPDPSGLLQAARLLGVDRHRCVYVGDSENDSEAAIAAGMTCVGVTWGIHTKATIQSLGFTYVIDFPHELIPLLG
jgi:phosphoglycolate phosphatase